MNTTEIDKYLLQIPGLHYAGVRAADRLPSIAITPNTAIVVNTETHTQRGEHWVAFYCNSDGYLIEYLDSYGRPPYQPDFQKFLRRNSHHCRHIYNRYRLQGYDTSVCGKYCLTYLYCRAVLDMSLNDYVQLFDLASPPVNDALVCKLFHYFFTNH